MSDAHDEHQSPIRTPKQLIIAIVASFVVPIVAIILLVSYVTSANQEGSGSEAMTEAAVAERLTPVARLELQDASAPRTLRSGEDVYKAACLACHGAGVAGAPRMGDAAAWAPRLAQGAELLFSHSIKGFQGKAGVMPPKGGSTDLADIEVQRAVVYMANASGGKLTEPAIPETPAAAPAEAAAPPLPVASPEIVAALAAARAGTPTAPVVSSAPAAGADIGKKIYDSACFACHGAGVAGAPKFGDKAAWSARIAQGMDTLYLHSIKGFQGKAGVMPPKGGSAASDDDIRAAVRYMVEAAR